MTALIPRPRSVLAPGAVHVPGWLDEREQRRLVEACREWARPPAGMRRTRLPGGGVMSVQTVCLGWHWEPYRYVRRVDGHPVKAFPGWLAELGRRAVAEAYAPGPVPFDDPTDGLADGPMGGSLNGARDSARSYAPDVALVNFYDADARMGLHQDRDERSRAPVVSLSLGDTGVFRFGNTESRSRPWVDVELESGDLVVFGGPSRLAYHGVTRIVPGTGPGGIGLDGGGRLNLTLRESGLDASC